MVLGRMLLALTVSSHLGPIAAYCRAAKQTPMRFGLIIEPEGATRIGTAFDQYCVHVGKKLRDLLSNWHQKLLYFGDLAPLS